MIRVLLILVAVGSGLYVLVPGPAITRDPGYPWLDDAKAVFVFLIALHLLGFDVLRWVPWFGRWRRNRVRRNRDAGEAAARPGD